jgi:hypothetical protein
MQSRGKNLVPFVVCRRFLWATSKICALETISTLQIDADTVSLLGKKERETLVALAESIF